MTSVNSVAVLGTGIMGAPMARNLARAGLDVRVWNRTRAKAEPLAEAGARVADTPAEAVDGADAVLTMLYDGAAVLDTMGRAAPALRPGALWIQSTTAGVEALVGLSRLAAERGLVFIDAPVLGTRQPAESGQLIVLAAGPEPVRPALAPLFDAIGSRTVWVGDDGAQSTASSLKLVVNSWVLALNNATGEALALARGLDVDPRHFLDAVAEGPLDNGYLRVKAQQILTGDLTPSFATATAEKDARLIVAAGERTGVRLDLAAAGADRFHRAVSQGHGLDDMAASYYASFEERGE
ncbi:NAD(P)-dependent oxidoreductase [Streptomyces sp. LX-29]|uniref:NAD(P)-dependent oxidoreductase n=1 Tax=Streptomyces sp. LX-29 TaxID=2900152 RepID=UPI00240E7744|nr:NAD(P)-dependent oxidoreductase [Streptomyces sp. LX-29]WFB11803.1 NAD(P)-dependent oxidoreductase [Streptomyces sp. LX-29]